MKLADSSKHLDSLQSFANLYGNKDYIWVDGGNGCALLKIPLGYSTYFKSVNQACFLDYISICEYDSKSTELMFQVELMICKPKLSEYSAAPAIPTPRRNFAYFLKKNSN